MHKKHSNIFKDKRIEFIESFWKKIKDLLKPKSVKEFDYDILQFQKIVQKKMRVENIRKIYLCFDEEIKEMELKATVN